MAKHRHGLWAVLAVLLMGAGPADDFDRLDGTGASRKRVDVIEWEGNLEIHVYPKNSVAGLALKLDKTNKDKPVMVIGYRFTNAPKKQLIRRAVLGITLNEGFKTYRDTTPPDYDKIIITANGLSKSKGLVAFTPDAEPKQLYPDGHPAIAAAEASDGADQIVDPMTGRRNPASGKGEALINDDDFGDPTPTSGEVDEDSGTIRRKSW